MEGLKRSEISFRRQGSSGLVWDDKMISASGELITTVNPNKSDDQSNPELRRSQSDGGGRKAYRTVKVQETEDPPSPRLSGCGFGFCKVFANPKTNSANKPKPKSKSKAKSKSKN